MNLKHYINFTLSQLCRQELFSCYEYETEAQKEDVVYKHPALTQSQSTFRAGNHFSL